MTQSDVQELFIGAIVFRDIGSPDLYKTDRYNFTTHVLVYNNPSLIILLTMIYFVHLVNTLTYYQRLHFDAIYWTIPGNKSQPH